MKGRSEGTKGFAPAEGFKTAASLSRGFELDYP